MNWKTYVAAQNAKAFVLPPGWDSRESIAEQLGCSPEKVREHLQPGIAAREIESRPFPVWDAQLGRKVTVTAYRQLPRAGAPQAESRQTIVEAKPLSKRPGSWSQEDKEAARAYKAQGLTYREIGQCIGRTREAVRLWLNKH